MSNAPSIDLPLDNTFRGALTRFFFAEEVPYGMALVRILMPLMLMINAVPRWEFARELYSADGAPAPLADNFGNFGFLPEFSGTVTLALYTAMLFLMVTTCIGWYSRISVLAANALYAYFGLMDSMSTLTKYTVIATHVLLLLGVSSCGAVWSVDSWLKNRGKGWSLSLSPDYVAPRYPIWPARCLQILLGMIYFGAAITKMHTPAFFSGDQLIYWMMSKLNNRHPLGDYLTLYPAVVVAMCYVAVTWEITFLFCVWHRWMRVPMLALGVLFHVMTTFTLGLVVFPLVMIAAYFGFVTEEDVRWCGVRFRRLQRRFAWMSRLRRTLTERAARLRQGAPIPQYVSAGAFAMLLALSAVLGVEAEYRLDPYAVRGPGGPLPLHEISEEEAQRLLTEMPLRKSDKFLAVDLGTIMFGEHLLNRRKVFTQGERALVQATLSPPHEDMWVECNLYDAEMKESEEPGKQGVRTPAPGRLISKVGQIMTREMLRGEFNYMLDESIVPGEYFIIVKSAGEEVARKQFTLLPRIKSASAN